MGAVLAFLGSKIGRYVIATAFILMLAGGLYAYIYSKGKTAGKSADEKATIEQQKRIDDAMEHGPRTLDDIDKRLREGKF